MTQTTISDAAKRLETAQTEFDCIESRYFAGTATAEALRAAWSEREAAEQDLQRAHTAARGMA